MNIIQSYASDLDLLIDAVIDKTVQLYKSSTLGQVTGRMTPARSLSIDRILDEREPWEDEMIVKESESLLI